MSDFISQLHWRPQIGDPTALGWLTVAAYAAATAACWRAARRVGRPWLAMAVVMGLLCVNKQLDLQSLLTDIGRVTARAQGWYRERRIVQRDAIIMTLALSLGGAAWVLFKWRAFWSNHRLLFAGLVFLGCFIAVRAISFHHVDRLLKTQFIGVRTNGVLELTGIGLVAAAAWFARPQPSRADGGSAG